MANVETRSEQRTPVRQVSKPEAVAMAVTLLGTPLAGKSVHDVFSKDTDATAVAHEHSPLTDKVSEEKFVITERDSHRLIAENLRKRKGERSAWRRMHTVPLFKQSDEKWGDADFGYGTTLASSGCGPTNLAMVMSYYKGRKILPPEVAKEVLKHKWRVEGEGTSHAAMTEIPKLYGLQSREISWSDAKKALSQGKPVIQSQGAGYFTSEGHYITLTGVDGNKFKVNDSAGRNRTRATEEQITASLNKSWLIEPAAQSQKSSPSPTRQ